jgi:ATP-dependent exoDNAse (exonuclease V) beta subunit
MENGKLTIYKASAGSGKTFKMVSEILALMLKSPKLISQIVAITFTKAATSNLKEKIIERLFLISQGNQKEIDFFKQNYQELSTLDAKYGKMVLEQFLFNISEFNVSTIDQFLYRIVTSFKKEFNLSYTVAIKEESTLIYKKALSRFLNFALNSENELVKEFLLQFIEHNLSKGKKFRLKGLLENSDIKKYIDYYAFNKPEQMSIKDAIEFYQTLLENKKDSKEDEQKKLNNTINLILDNYHINTVSRYLDYFVEQIKKEENVLFFTDPPRLINDYLLKEPVSYIYYKLGNRFKYFLIDEFQDTSQQQWTILRPLLKESLDNGYSSMLVGDAKQSIYRWRNADANLLANEVENTFKGQVNVKFLSYNYRSDIKVVNKNNKIINDFINSEDLASNNLLQSIYLSHKQEPIKKTGNGNVEINYLEIVSDTKYTVPITEHFEAAFDILKKIIGENQFQFKEIAFLFGKNYEMEQFANYLSSKNEELYVPFISTNALLVQNSIELEIIELAFNIIENFDSISKSNFKQIKIFELISLLKRINPKMGLRISDFTAEISEIEPLIISIGKLGNLSAVDVLCRLQGIDDLKYYLKISTVFSYLIDLAKNHSVDTGNQSLRSFLSFIYENPNLIAESNSSQNAVTLTTIHKSKGLEYKVVIVPKFHFEFKGRNHEFWVDSPKIDHYLFQNKQKYSIKLSESTYNSHFGDQALKEESMLEIDNLNKIYVAITRAEERLYLIGVKPRLKKDHSGFAFYSMYFTNILYKVRYNNPSA